MNPDPEKIGRYQVERVIGRGSMGVVYQAQDPLLKRSVAVKIMQGKRADDSDTIARFKREAEISAKLNHPNIITIYDVGVDPAVGPFLTMEYIVGASLARIIRMELPVDEVMRLLLQAMSALQAAHVAGIVHRDVKPENMLVSQTGHLKLMDFGLARGDQSRLTAEGMLFGTPSYTAPELLTGHSPSPATDRYAFAVTAFEALTGALPYTGPSVGSTLYRIVNDPPAIPADLDPGLQALFAKALSKDPAERHPDLPGFMEALIHAVSLEQEQRSRLLDSLDSANTNVSTFNFLPASSEGVDVPATHSDSAAAMATSRTDPRASDSGAEPPTYPLDLHSTPVPASASTVALPEPFPSPTPVPMPPPASTPRKSGHGLRWALLGTLLLGVLGVGGYALLSPKRLPRYVAVHSEPSGASVYLDEQPLGETPLDRVELKGDSPMLKAKLEGYLTQNHPVLESETSVNFLLKKPPHFISVIT
ncbi:MAG: serine/threonine protein kinase, partial [Acidobacteriota bacterium]|nr:serine/threonine protein kinase [Acidobacteriota bacterium]